MSYLNTKPLLFGIKNHPVINEIELVEDYPSAIGQMLINGEIDIGLIPVALIPELKEWSFAADYCIGCDGPVASVCIFSEVPIEQIQKVYLDYQSRTSVLLAQILLKEYWKKNVGYLSCDSDEYRKKISGTTAALVIGDRALEQKNISAYFYDLGEAWKAHTGLPFVFAAWVSNKKLPVEFVERFNEANQYGLDHLDEVITQNEAPDFDLDEYFKKYISYSFDEGKTKGLNLFLQKIGDKYSTLQRDNLLRDHFS